jgi:hypothetical protein
MQSECGPFEKGDPYDSRILGWRRSSDSVKREAWSESDYITTPLGTRRILIDVRIIAIALPEVPERAIERKRKTNCVNS